MQKTIAVVEEKVLGAEKILGTLAGTWEQAEKLYARGYQLIMLMADGASLAKLTLATVAQFRTEYPEC